VLFAVKFQNQKFAFPGFGKKFGVSGAIRQYGCNRTKRRKKVLSRECISGRIDKQVLNDIDGTQNVHNRVESSRIDRIRRLKT
jgi:hypothetical protein